MSGSRILCVHEQTAELREVRLVLEEAGYEVLVASDADRALRLLMKDEVDGVVLSYGVSTPDGRSLRNRIWNEFPEVPMLLFSDVNEIRSMPLNMFRAYLEHPDAPASMLVSV